MVSRWQCEAAGSQCRRSLLISAVSVVKVPARYDFTALPRAPFDSAATAALILHHGQQTVFLAVAPRRTPILRPAGSARPTLSANGGPRRADFIAPSRVGPGGLRQPVMDCGRTCASTTHCWTTAGLGCGNCVSWQCSPPSSSRAPPPVAPNWGHACVLISRDASVVHQTICRTKILYARSSRRPRANAGAWDSERFPPTVEGISLAEIEIEIRNSKSLTSSAAEELNSPTVARLWGGNFSRRPTRHHVGRGQHSAGRSGDSLSTPLRACRAGQMTMIWPCPRRNAASGIPAWTHWGLWYTPPRDMIYSPHSTPRLAPSLNSRGAHGAGLPGRLSVYDLTQSIRFTSAGCVICRLSRRGILFVNAMYFQHNLEAGAPLGLLKCSGQQHSTIRFPTAALRRGNFFRRRLSMTGRNPAARIAPSYIRMPAILGEECAARAGRRISGPIQLWSSAGCDREPNKAAKPFTALAPRRIFRRHPRDPNSAPRC